MFSCLHPRRPQRLCDILWVFVWRHLSQTETLIMCESIWIVRALVGIPAALWFIFPVYHLSVGTQIVLTNAKTRRGKHVIRAIKYSKLKRTRCMRFWHLETKTCKAKHKLVQWDNRSGEKLQGFTKTSEDRQQTIQSLIMKGSCERVRLEGIRGVRVVWE